MVKKKAYYTTLQKAVQEFTSLPEIVYTVLNRSAVQSCFQIFNHVPSSVHQNVRTRYIQTGKGKEGKAIPLQAWTGPQVEAPRFQDSRHMKVVRL